MRSRPVATHRGSVSQDWRTPLHGEKSHLYLDYVRQLETSYLMLSINLDEALGLRRGGSNSNACQVLSVAPDLCERLAHPLASLLRIMLKHSRHFGIAPHIAPLDAHNFHRGRSQRVAIFNDLLSRVLLTRRSQFSYKISALADLVEELSSSFSSTVQELATGSSLQPQHDWEFLDSVHYDLNTCLRETVVLLKSFLHALPDQQLTDFEASLLHSRRLSFSRPPARAILPIDGWLF